MYNKRMRWFVLSVGIIVLFVLILSLMGRAPWCPCGYINFWHGDPLSPESSQHLTDWYTFSHIIHGFVFYWILWLIGRRLPRDAVLRVWPLGLRLLLALVLETGWEVIENTDLVINYYRQNTLSLEYGGDSIINSVFDVLFMILGFFIAWRLPVWTVVALAVLMEVVVAYYIRDNLTLNILMFIYPFKSVLKWQLGG